MATKSQRYDHPAYTVPQAVSVDAAAGSAAVGGKFTAFTTLLLKSATLTVTTAGTTTAAASNNYTFQIRGTATTSVGAVANLGTTGAYTPGTNVVLGGGTTTMTQGETLVAVRGTDATAAAAVTYEFLINPGANITA